MMPAPNADVAKGVGQDLASQDMTHEYDKRHGTYDGGLAKGGKPTQSGPGTLPNTPSPVKITGG